MDNLTHSLVGWALAETGLKNRTRKGLAACVLAANMPDIDVFFGWAPWAPLAMHRGFTHGLVGGVLLMPPLLAGLLWLLDRWQLSRGVIFASGLQMRWGWLVALCYLGALTHPLLDLQNTYAVQLMSPLSTHWFHTDSLFIISPWLLAMLGAGIWLARRRYRQRRAGAGTPAIVALAGVALFIIANIAISAFAWNATDDHPDRVFASPEPFAFWRRDAVWREQGMLFRGHFDPLESMRTITRTEPPIPDNMGDPLVKRAIAASPEAADFLAWAQMPFARVKSERCSADVTFGDARYVDGRAARSFKVVARVPTAGRGCPAR